MGAGPANLGDPASANPARYFSAPLDGVVSFCANCHPSSGDGKTLGTDLDGPQNDKGLYAIAHVAPKMSIREQDVISWSSFRDQPTGRMRVGFRSGTIFTVPFNEGKGGRRRPTPERRGMGEVHQYRAPGHAISHKGRAAIHDRPATWIDCRHSFDSGNVGCPSSVAYTATKSALLGFKLSGACDYARFNIRFNALCRGR